MKKYLLYHLGIVASISIAAVACTPSTPIATTPSASPKSTATATSSPTATSAPTATSTPTTKPSDSPKPSSTDAPSTSTEKAPDTVRVAVINNSGKDLTGVYMSAPSKRDWGSNELTSPIKDREKADFEWKRSDYKGVDAGCVFDVGVEYGDGAITVLDPIDLCKTPAINLK